MEDRQKARLLKRIVESDGLPALSPLAIRLVELATDDRTVAQDLAEIIEKDPALTTRLLKLVSSAFFARPAHVTSISQAVVLLGFKKIRLILELMARGGMRVGEVLKLTPRDVQDRKLALRDPKSGKEREHVFIPQKVADRLKEYIRDKSIQPHQRI